MSDWTTSLSYAASDFPPDSGEDSFEGDESLDAIMALADESSVPFVETPFTIAARNAQVRKHKEASSRPSLVSHSDESSVKTAPQTPTMRRSVSPVDLTFVSSGSEVSDSAQFGSPDTRPISDTSRFTHSDARYKTNSAGETLLDKYFDEGEHSYAGMIEDIHEPASSSTWQHCPSLTFGSSSEHSELMTDQPSSYHQYWHPYRHPQQNPFEKFHRDSRATEGESSSAFDRSSGNKMVCRPAAAPVSSVINTGYQERQRYPVSTLLASNRLLERAALDPRAAKEKADAAMAALRKYKSHERRERKESPGCNYRCKDREDAWSTLNVSQTIKTGTSPNRSLPAVRLPVKGAPSRSAVFLPLYRSPGSTLADRRRAIAYLDAKRADSGPENAEFQRPNKKLFQPSPVQFKHR